MKTKAESFLEYQKKFFSSLVELTKKKNHDYAGASNDPFTNFLLVERSQIVSAEKGIMVRMMDKVSRINNFIDQGVLKVKDESIEDTLKDLANYSALLANYIHHKKIEHESHIKISNTKRGSKHR